MPRAGSFVRTARVTRNVSDRIRGRRVSRSLQTSTPYAGNPACVVLLPAGGFPTDTWMQKVAITPLSPLNHSDLLATLHTPSQQVALEMHLSETVFLVPTGELY